MSEYTRMRRCLLRGLKEGLPRCLGCISAVPGKLGVIALLVFGLTLAEPAHAATAKPRADIVYSARYYKPGMQRSHYKIWRTDPSGLRRFRVTSGSTEDRSPIWLADGKTILFVRESANMHRLCTVDQRGGLVTELSVLPPGYAFIESVAPNRRMLVYLVHDSSFKLILFDVSTRRERPLGFGSRTAWSPDGRMLYITAWEKTEEAAHILDVATGNRTPLTGCFGAATWLDNHTLVAESFAQDQERARLTVLKADGTKERDVLLPFIGHNGDEELSPFADNLFAIPGVDDGVLYGRHAGNSTAGEAQRFYRVGLREGQPTVVGRGRDLSWVSDGQFFVTGDGRSLARLDRKRKVWVSPLSVVSMGSGKAHPLVRGLVSVGGFDWRPSPQKGAKIPQEDEAPKK